MTKTNQFTAGFILALIFATTIKAQTVPSGQSTQNIEARSPSSPQPSPWESPARLRHGITGGTSGTLRIDSRGVEFAPLKGASQLWTFAQIRSLDLQRHRLSLIGYDNRSWRLPGTQQFDWELKKEITPAIAASLTGEIARPVRNRVPDPDAPVMAVIAVRRSDHFAGSNGLLRIREQGIDYVTAQSDQNRSWRWVDLQTLSNPDPYHLFVFGYRDSYAFDLKGAFSRELFNRLSDEIWTHNENEMRGSPVTTPPGTPTNIKPRKDE